MEQILRALVVVHGHCIVHRDVQPQNFIFAEPSPFFEVVSILL